MDFPQDPGIGLVDGRFVDENAATGSPGSTIPASWGNGLTDEMLNVIRAAGLDPDEDDVTQLLVAIRRVAAGRLLNIQIFTAPGTYTPTAGTAKVIVEVQGGGGGGGGTPASATGYSSCGGAGGGGAYVKALITDGFAGAAVTIGAAGAGGVAGANTGTAGGASAFGSFVSCPGGQAGAAGQASNSPGFAGYNTGSTAPTVSGATTLASRRGLSTGWGLTGMNNGIGVGSAPGASSPFGSGGNSGSSVGIAVAGNSATGYGASGSGGISGGGGAAVGGGNGSPGIVVIWEYA